MAYWRLQKSDWEVVPGTEPKETFAYHVGGFLYIAHEAESGRPNRFHLYAIPDGGLAIPVRIGNEITLGFCCRIVERHQNAVLAEGQDEVTKFYLEKA